MPDSRSADFPPAPTATKLNLLMTFPSDHGPVRSLARRYPALGQPAKMGGGALLSRRGHQLMRFPLSARPGELSEGNFLRLRRLGAVRPEVHDGVFPAACGALLSCQGRARQWGLAPRSGQIWAGRWWPHGRNLVQRGCASCLDATVDRDATALGSPRVIPSWDAMV